MALKRAWMGLLLLLLAGCTLPGGDLPSDAQTATPLVQVGLADVTPTASPSPVPTLVPTLAPSATPFPMTPTPVPPLDEAALGAARVTLPETGTIQLEDGVYNDDDVHVSLVAWTSGILIYNGAQDAAAVVSVNLGGSGNFAYLVVFYNEGGTPVQQGDAVFIEDRPQINDVMIWDGRVILDAVLHWYDEPFCCPSKHVIQTYKQTDLGWQLERVASYLADVNGEEQLHSVNFLSVIPEEGVLRVIVRTGAMPADGVLDYRWFSPDGSVLLGQGQITVTPDDPEDAAGAGHFEAQIPLPEQAADMELLLRVLEISTRDGSTLAMDSFWRLP